MYLSSKLWFLAAVKETETSEELFISLVGLIFFLGLRSACIASAYGLPLFSGELLETLKVSNEGMLKNQGYIQSRLAILERLVGHIVSEKENVSVF